MRIGRGVLGMSVAVVLMSGPVLADDNAAINDIYRQFFGEQVDPDHIATLYRDDVIHVGYPKTPLLSGKQAFMETNILPMAEMVNAGQLSIVGKAYVMRRIVIGDMANDVGYLYFNVSQGEAEPTEQLQKFSWVFVKEEGVWRVATDFDATPAPLSLLDKLQAQFLVE